MSIKERLTKLIAEQLGVDEDRVTSDTALADLGADSLDMLEIVMALEDELDLRLDDEDLEKVKTVGDIEKLLTEAGGQEVVSI